MIVAGIDYSMSCPAIVVGDINAKFEDLQFYSFAKKKKQISIKSQIHLWQYPLYKSPEERFDLISTIVIDTLKKSGVEYCMMEGYSYGSRNGKVFEIAENTAMIKHKMSKSDIPFEVVPPTVVKKKFCGRGTATKEVMYMYFRDKHCPYEIHHAIGILNIPLKIGNPVSDMIDAYAIWLLARDKMLPIVNK